MGKNTDLIVFDEIHKLENWKIGKLENTIALHLLKHTQYLYDAKGETISLACIKTKEKKEVDFVIVKDGKPTGFIEAKLTNKNISKNLHYFANRFEDANFIQLVHNLKTTNTKMVLICLMQVIG